MKTTDNYCDVCGYYHKSKVCTVCNKNLRNSLFNSTWVRLHPDALDELQEEYEKAYESKSSPEYQWFVQRLDYHEMCQRKSRFATTKDKLRAILLWIVEKLT